MKWDEELEYQKQAVSRMKKELKKLKEKKNKK